MGKDVLQITKLDAATRQLRTAISLWFDNGDAVAIHTLAAAAHELFHELNKLGGHEPLIFDSLRIKDEYRKQWIAAVKKHANFFKHADRDPHDKIEFNPDITEYLFIGCITAMKNMDLNSGVEEQVFGYWCLVNRPEALDKEVYKKFPQGILDSLKGLGRLEFFNAFKTICEATKTGSL